MGNPGQKLDGQVPIRFEPDMAETARRLAEREGMTLSAWIRRAVDQEVARRDKYCQHCGQAVPAETISEPT